MDIKMSRTDKLKYPDPNFIRENTQIIKAIFSGVLIPLTMAAKSGTMEQNANAHPAAPIIWFPISQALKNNLSSLSFLKNRSATFPIKNMNSVR